MANPMFVYAMANGGSENRPPLGNNTSGYHRMMFYDIWAYGMNISSHAKF